MVTRCDDAALARAKELDAALAKGTVLGPLHGVPVTIKDAFDTAGVRTTGGTKGRADHIPQSSAPAVERLWRAVKYEDVFLRGYESVPELERGLRAYFAFYNTERLHQSLGHKTPVEVYRAGRSKEPARE